MFTKAEDVSVGDVVCLNSQKMIQKCSQRAQTSVIGVVSEAPTIIGRASAPNSVPIGIVGVVRTKVTGNVTMFDLLTPSAKKGYAEKATKDDFGAIIGKAMESCSQKECEIDVLVGLK
jgi:hypothetical protein